MMLEVSAEVSAAEAQQMCADGAVFDTTGEIACGGIGVSEVARLADAHCSVPAGKDGQLPGAGSTGGTDHGKPGGKKDGGNKGGKPEVKGKGAESVVPLTSLAQAKAASINLTKKVGEGAKLAMELGRAGCSEQLIEQINKSVGAMKTLHGMLEERVSLAVSDPPDYYDSMWQNANAQIDWFNNRAAYGKGLINIQKRLDKIETDAEAAKAKQKADAAKSGAVEGGPAAAGA